MKRLLLRLLPILVLSLAALAAGACGEHTLTLATTTSTQDSGLLEELIPPFERANGVKVKVVAVGTGQALALGARGDADILVVHDPAREQQFMSDGYGSRRDTFMYNRFVVVGPSGDPAGIGGGKKATEALARIAAGHAPFVSRGDESGTHAREKELWAKISTDPGKQDWYRSAGQGMGATLSLADQVGAYTLSDESTYLAFKDRVNLRVMVEGDEDLQNLYSVISLDPSRFPSLQHKLAAQFVEYLTSDKGRSVIDSFGTAKYGKPLFSSIKSARQIGGR